jgi:DNA-binding transcriptional MerR regulator
MTIGQLAGHFGLATHVLRHWEAMGLIAPAERVNGRRRYRESQVAHVAMIVRGKQAGLSLDQIREIIDAPDGPTRREVLRRRHAELEQRVADIQASKAMLEHAIHCPVEDFIACPSFQRIVRRIAEGESPDCSR